MIVDKCVNLMYIPWDVADHRGQFMSIGVELHLHHGWLRDCLCEDSHTLLVARGRWVASGHRLTNGWPVSLWPGWPQADQGWPCLSEVYLHLDCVWL